MFVLMFFDIVMIRSYSPLKDNNHKFYEFRLSAAVGGIRNRNLVRIR